MNHQSKKRSFYQLDHISDSIKYENKQPSDHKRRKINAEYESSIIDIFDLQNIPYTAYHILSYLSGDSQSFIHLTSTCKIMYQWRIHCVPIDVILLLFKNKNKQETEQIIKEYNLQPEIKLPVNSMFPVTIMSSCFNNHFEQIKFYNVNMKSAPSFKINSVLQQEKQLIRRNNISKQLTHDFYKLQARDQDLPLNSAILNNFPLDFDSFDSLEIYSSLIHDHVYFEDIKIKCLMSKNVKIILGVSTVNLISQTLLNMSKLRFTNCKNIYITILDDLWIYYTNWIDDSMKHMKLKSFELKIIINNAQEKDYEFDVEHLMKSFNLSGLKNLSLCMNISSHQYRYHKQKIDIGKLNISHNLDHLELSNMEIVNEQDQKSDTTLIYQSLTSFKYLFMDHNLKNIDFIEKMKNLKYIDLIFEMNGRRDQTEHQTIFDLSKMNHEKVEKVSFESNGENNVRIKLSNTWIKSIQQIRLKECMLCDQPSRKNQFKLKNMEKLTMIYTSNKPIKNTLQMYADKKMCDLEIRALNNGEIRKGSVELDLSFEWESSNLKRLFLQCDSLIIAKDSFCQNVENVDMIMSRSYITLPSFINNLNHSKHINIESRSAISCFFILENQFESLETITINSFTKELKSWIMLLQKLQYCKQLKMIDMNITKQGCIDTEFTELFEKMIQQIKYIHKDCIVHINLK